MLTLVAVESIAWVLGGPLSQALVTDVEAGDVLWIAHCSQGSGGADMLAPTSPADPDMTPYESSEPGWAPVIKVWTATASGDAIGNPIIAIPQNGASRHKADVFIWREAEEAPGDWDEDFGDSTAGHITPDVNAAIGDEIVRYVATRGGDGATYDWPTSTEKTDSAAGSGGSGGVFSTAVRTADADGAQGTETATGSAVTNWGEYVSLTMVAVPVVGGTPGEVTLAGVLPALDGSFVIQTPGEVTLTGVLPALTSSVIITSEGSVSLSSERILDALRSHALATGRFEGVSSHEPKNPPGNGLHAAIWAQHIGPVPRGSSLNATSALMVFNLRIYSNMLQEPQDEIDPEIIRAVDELMGAYSGDFTLGGLVRAVDLMGMSGQTLRADAGYISVGGAQGGMFRVMVIQIPLIINDAWEQMA